MPLDFSQTSLEERLWSHIEKSAGSDSCWKWLGGRTSAGYGLVRVSKGRQGYTHRVAWMLTYGPIPDGLFVLHKCDCPSCVNPSHLFLGTAGDNARDMIAKGRDRLEAQPGERHGMAKLTEVEVREIRELYLAGGISQRELSRMYHVTKSTILFIVSRQTWRHI